MVGPSYGEHGSSFCCLVVGEVAVLPQHLMQAAALLNIFVTVRSSSVAAQHTAGNARVYVAASTNHMLHGASATVALSATLTHHALL